MDALKDIKLTLFKNNETIVLKEGIDYEIKIQGAEGELYLYTYTVYKENFVDDGLYQLSVYSQDDAGNISENNQETKNAEIRFGIDTIQPDIVVMNLANDGFYEMDDLTVAMRVNDNLCLKTVQVYLDDYNTVYASWNAEDLKRLSAQELCFDISGDSLGSHKVKIVCEDAAGNKRVEEISGFFVTSNRMAVFLKRNGLFLVIALGICLLGCVIFLRVHNKRSKPLSDFDR